MYLILYHCYVKHKESPPKTVGEDGIQSNQSSQKSAAGKSLQDESSTEQIEYMIFTHFWCYLTKYEAVLFISPLKICV